MFSIYYYPLRYERKKRFEVNNEGLEEERKERRGKDMP